MPPVEQLPQIIQGGMGAAVSGWRLARAVSMNGGLGVVSGTGIDSVLVRRLQEGDPGGIVREAIAAFPCRRTAERTLERFPVNPDRPDGKPYRMPPMFRLDSPPEQQALTALAAFVEVWLARRGHNGPVGINLLEKIALPNPAILLGATLAGVDYVLMGAGIPIQIPGILDRLAAWQPIELKVAVEGDKTGVGAVMTLDPATVLDCTPGPLKRPAFLAIVSSPTIAQTLLKRASGSVQGFVVEGNTAGGHNAPPRGPVRRNERGEPIYGERDVIDPAAYREIGKPFWLAGGQGRPGALAEARRQGAVGIQVGTLFAFCRESGLDPELRGTALAAAAIDPLDVYTDPLASPTGFPFKVVRLAETLTEEDVYAERTRVCDAGYLRRVCLLPDGRIGYRCPAEPEADYVAKGGDAADCEGRKCLCNALLANLGLGQWRRDGRREQPLLTAGDDLSQIGDVMGDQLSDYSAADVLAMLRQEAPLAVETPGSNGG